MLAAFILGWVTVALQETLDLLPLPPVPNSPMLTSPTSPPSSGQPRAVHQLLYSPGTPVPLVSPARLERLGAQPTADDLTAVTALRRPRSTLRRCFPGLSGGLMPRGDLFSCHWAR